MTNESVDEMAAKIKEKLAENDKKMFGQAVKEPAQEAFRNVTTPQTDEWEPPIPFENVEVPIFPIECLPSIVSDYVIAVSEADQTPVDMPAVAGLIAISVCVQGKYKIQGKPDWMEPLNLYSAIVANPAERKSATLNHMMKYIHEYEYLKNQQLLPDVERNRMERKTIIKELDKLIDDVAKGKASKEQAFQKQDELTNFEEKRLLRLLADDVSPEALTSLIADNGGIMSVVSSEGGIFDILQGRYTNGVNLDTFLKAHSGDPIRVDRKGRESEYIPEPCLTVLLSIQPQVLDGIMANDTFRGRGLTARFLFCIPVSRVGDRQFETKPIPADCKEQFRELCFDLLDIEPSTPVDILQLSPEAYRISADFAKELEPRLIDDLDSIKDFAGKLHGAVLRIAGVLHLVKQRIFAATTPVHEETMQEAVIIGNYFLEHAKAAYQLMGSNPDLKDAAYIMKRIENHKIEKTSKRELMRLCKKFKTADELTTPLMVLLEYGYFREERQVYTGSGRPPEPIYIVNPLLYKNRA